jgi:radical SAM superfamily enzyme YgiQ (UPF0313 family)
MMKILLVQPPSRQKQYENIVVPPLGLGYLAAILERAKYDVQILDAFALGQSWPEFEAAIKNARADVIGIGGMTPVIDNTYRAAKICRKYCRFLVVGGPHVTVFMQDIFRQIPETDYAIYGEGELTFLDLAGCLSGKKQNLHIPGLLTHESVNLPREFIGDLDSLPFPARHLLPNHRYKYIFSRKKAVTTILTSRGCPYHCVFCDKSVFGSRFRARSAHNVLDEISQIADYFKDVSIIFYDDLFTFDRERVIAVCRGILERGIKVDWKCEGRVDHIDAEMLGWMKRAGCSMIAYGVESGNQAGLDYLRKKTNPQQIKDAFALSKKYGIRTMAYFILGIPVETYDDEVQTIQFAMKLKPDYAQFSVLSPFPGTDIYLSAIRSGNYREVDANNPVDKDLKRPVVLSPNWDEKKLNSIVHEAHRRFYLRFGYILKRLLSLHDLREAAYFLMTGLRIIAWSFKPKQNDAC